jgi:alkaline phosphatase D
MLGCMTQSSVKFWARTANELPIQVLVSQSENMQSPVKSETARTDKAQDYTAIVSIEGLKPDTRYYYQLLIDGGEQGGPASFRTFPKKGSKARFQIGFGGGAGYTPQHEKM